MEYRNLLDICEVYQPKTIATKNFQSDGSYYVYGANGIIGRYNQYNHESSEIVMGCRGACGAINVTLPKSWINGNAMVIHPKGVFPLSQKYLYYCLQSVDKKRIITGTAVPQITRTNLKDLFIPICGIDEQSRIVARIEEMFSQLESGVETLRQTKEQLAVYRQAVLKEAFDSLASDGEKYAIKDVCHEIKVGIVIKPAQYYTDADHGVKAFRSANVREFRINDSDWVYLSHDGHAQNKRSEIHTGDVLIVRSGYPGTACVVNDKFNGCNAIDILIAVPNTELITPEYLCAYTNSPYGRKLVSEKKRGVAQAHLNVGGYSKMQIPVPSIETQNQIVSEIAARLSMCDQIEQTVDAALQQAEALRQSILKKAFEGGL